MRKNEGLRKTKNFSPPKTLKTNFSSSRIKFQEKFPAIRPLLQMKQLETLNPEILKNSPSGSKKVLKSNSELNIFLKTMKKPEIFPNKTTKAGLKSSLKRPKPLPQKPKQVKFEDQVRSQKILSHNSAKFFASLKPSPLSPSKEVKRSPRCTVDELLKIY